MKDKSKIWYRHIERQQSSSLTIQNYCKQHRLSMGMFFYWKRKQREVPSKEEFTEIQITDQLISPQAVHVRFPTGVEMWFEPGTDALYLRALAGC